MASENGKVMNYACPICGKEMLVLPGSYDYEYICADDDCPASEHYMTTPYTEALSVVLTGKDADLAEERARADRLAEAAKAVLDNEPSDGAANNYIYIEHAMLCGVNRGRDCDCPMEDYIIAMNDLRAALAEYHKEEA